LFGYVSGPNKNAVTAFFPIEGIKCCSNPMNGMTS